MRVKPKSNNSEQRVVKFVRTEFFGWRKTDFSSEFIYLDKLYTRSSEHVHLKEGHIGAIFIVLYLICFLIY